jgi:hypothetical protein
MSLPVDPFLPLAFPVLVGRPRLEMFLKLQILDVAGYGFGPIDLRTTALNLHQVRDYLDSSSLNHTLDVTKLYAFRVGAKTAQVAFANIGSGYAQLDI